MRIPSLVHMMLLMDLEKKVLGRTTRRVEIKTSAALHNDNGARLHGKGL